MKSTYLFLLSFTILYLQRVSAQNTTDWFTEGAQWGYNYESLGGPGEEYYWVDGDTVVGGNLCARLRHFRVPGVPWGSGGSGETFCFSRNDSVFYRSMYAGNFRLLYDFTRQVGDTLQPLPNGLYAFGVVLETGQALHLGIPLRYQDVRLENPDWDSTYRFYDTRVWERIGGEDHLLYWDVQSPITEIQYYLNCYRDDEYPISTSCLPPAESPYYGLPIGFFQSGQTATWSEEKRTWCYFTGYQYHAEGDSVIWGAGQGKKLYYREVYYGTDPCPDGSLAVETGPWHLVGLLDQSGKQVYFTRLSDDWSLFPYGLTDSFPPLEEQQLLYDFDVTSGDVLHWKPAPNIVAYIDSIQVEGGSWRQRYFFADASGAVDSTYYWLEGVGGSHGLFTPYIYPNTADVSQQLRCLRGNNNLIYRTVDAVFCDSVTVSTPEVSVAGQEVRLYPNPASGHFYVEIPKVHLPATIMIYDALGKLTDVQTAHQSPLQIEAKNPGASAAFFVYIQTKDQLIVKRLLFSKKHAH
jgi:hypothetical protein